MFSDPPIHRVPFASVNRRDDPGYCEGWVRHHLCPQQSKRDEQLRPFLSTLGACGFSIDDFSANGIMLPALESISRVSGLPLHVGGHAAYNLRVIDRMHEIRATSEMIADAGRRQRFAILWLGKLQLELRESIMNQRVVTLDHLSIRGASDDDLDTLVDALLSAVHARRQAARHLQLAG